MDLWCSGHWCSPPFFRWALSEYRHILFDLDRTLWDFETNSRATLRALYNHFGLHQIRSGEAIDLEDAFHHHNELLWQKYARGEVSKSELRIRRFFEAFRSLGIEDNELAVKANDYYIDQCPKNGRLFPGTLPILDQLRGHFQLHLVTNGFETTQLRKLEYTGLTDYFDHHFVSERIGFRKPDRQLFDHVLNVIKSEPRYVLMVGDDLKNDIEGARNAGIDQVWVHAEAKDHTSEATYVINTLMDLPGKLGID